MLYDTHSITTPTLVSTLQFKYSYGSTFCHRGNELWILGGSFVRFLAVAHFISHLNFSQKVLNLFDLVISTKYSHKDLAVNYAMILFASSRHFCTESYCVELIQPGFVLVDDRPSLTQLLSCHPAEGTKRSSCLSIA